MLAKKVYTQELRKIVSYYKEEITEKELNSLGEKKSESTLKVEEVYDKIRMIPLSDEDEDWVFLENLQKCDINEEEMNEVVEYAKDIL